MGCSVVERKDRMKNQSLQSDPYIWVCQYRLEVDLPTSPSTNYVYYVKSLLLCSHRVVQWVEEREKRTSVNRCYEYEWDR